MNRGQNLKMEESLQGILMLPSENADFAHFVTFVGGMGGIAYLGTRPGWQFPS